MTRMHKIVLALSAVIIVAEILLLTHYRLDVIDWVSHNLWVVILPFLKGIFKKLLIIKFAAFLKASFVLLWHLMKLLLLKGLKTLTIRYGIFFTQNRWYWIRRAKVVFLRRGKQFFRSIARFWRQYEGRQKLVILIAFFPVGLVLFFLGLSFNITRKTMVKKTQESAVFQAATTASKSNRGIRAWIRRLDEATLHKIRELTPRAISNKQDVIKNKDVN